MKSSLKLFTSYKLSKNGFPVYVELSDKGKRKRKSIGYSFLEDWDNNTNQPFRHHPHYFELLPIVLEYQAKISKLNYGNYNFEDALFLLFDEVPVKDMRFFDACLVFCDGSGSGIIYKAVLNSFNSFYPGILIHEISSEIAKQYMDFISLKQQPNGVHAYMRTLNALFNKVTGIKNPFKGIRPKKERTRNKALLIEDVRKIATTCTFKRFRGRYHKTNETINHWRYIWLLMFYLGGIDLVDLANLRYDRHVVNGRIQFNRFKGGTSVFVNNIIPDQALELLKHFKCYPYLVPIYKRKSYRSWASDMNVRFIETTNDLGLTKRPLTKAARYTFITRAQQLLIDERITVEIVGHQQSNTHSIYTDEFPLEVRDEAHLKIISIS